MTANAVDVDQEVLERLDFDVKCEAEECDEPATWRIAAHTRCCRWRIDALVCDKHKRAWVQRQETPTPNGSVCEACRRVHFTRRLIDALVIEAITPLDQGEGR